MSTEKRLSTREAAEYLGVCKQRIATKILQGHFKRVSRCDCGMSTMIPLAEVSADMLKTSNKRKRK